MSWWKRAFGAALLATLVLAVGAWAAIAWREREEHAARTRLTEFEQSLALGQPKADIRVAFATRDMDGLKLDSDGDCWSIATPRRWGATDWLLILEFRENALAAVAYRTGDGLTHRPPGSQPDRQTTGADSVCLPQPRGTISGGESE